MPTNPINGELEGLTGTQDTHGNVCQILSFIQFAMEGVEEKEITTQQVMGLHWILDAAKDALEAESGKLKRIAKVERLKA